MPDPGHPSTRSQAKRMRWFVTYLDLRCPVLLRQHRQHRLHRPATRRAGRR